MSKFICEYCNLKSNDYENFISHFQNDNHKNIINKKFGYENVGPQLHSYTCKKCDFSTHKSDTIREHLNESGHKDKSYTNSYVHVKPTGNKSYKCDLCNYSINDLMTFCNKHLCSTTHQQKINPDCKQLLYQNKYEQVCWK